MLNIVSGKITRAVRTVIYGVEGIGKSTLASRFPEPLFIDVESGTAQLDVNRAFVSSWDELLDDVRQVAQAPGICKTLILDTADRAEALCIDSTLQKYNLKSIESPDYGKGYTYIGEEWLKLNAAFDQVIKAGVNVTVIAHARQRKIELPDQNGKFDHWEMKLSKQVAPLLKEWADLLLFLNYKTYVVTTKNNNGKAQGGKRVMFTSHNPVYDAKNRYGLPEEMDLDYSGIAHLFGRVKKEESPLEKLQRMMEEAGISEAQMREVVAAKGLCEAETPLSEYPERIISAFCLKHFEKIVNQIRQASGSSGEG